MSNTRCQECYEKSIDDEDLLEVISRRIVEHEEWNAYDEWTVLKCPHGNVWKEKTADDFPIQALRDLDDIPGFR